MFLPRRVVRVLVARHAPDVVHVLVAPPVPMERVLGVHFVKDAEQTLAVKRRVVPRLEVPPLLRASACCPQLRLLVPQQSVPALRPFRARPWSLVR